jgi:hypothetical protein
VTWHHYSCGQSRPLGIASWPIKRSEEPQAADLSRRPVGTEVRLQPMLLGFESADWR